MYLRCQHCNIGEGVQTSLGAPGRGKQRHQENVCFVGTMFLQHLQSSAHCCSTFCISFIKIGIRAEPLSPDDLYLFYLREWVKVVRRNRSPTRLLSIPTPASSLRLCLCNHNTVWRVIFVESLKRPSKLIFVVLNFVTATSPGVWYCTSDDVIDTRARSRSQSSLL